jgi:hypothetical protein
MTLILMAEFKYFHINKVILLSTNYKKKEKKSFGSKNVLPINVQTD